ncbi:MAG: LysR family transcriptional regulator [Synergistaceae bacterium]|nr:LysR family transcriptional regulator [Synergistaceae bacterium]
MELRTLKYFLEVAEQESVTKAALKLHLTQPTLSRQIAMLEQETGKKLYIRTNYNIKLTEDGILLKERAREIIELEAKTLAELVNSDNANITGTVYIGAGETSGVRHLAKIIKSLREDHPGIKYRMISGDSEDITEKLDKGLIDFGLFVGKVNLDKYNCVSLPDSDRWGVIVRLSDKLSIKSFITPEDLRGRELLFSHQAKSQGEFSNWLGYPLENLNIIGTHNLAFNASIMVREGLGLLVTIEGIISTLTENKLKFIPFRPEIKAGLVLAWKKDAYFTKAARKFLEYFSII